MINAHQLSLFFGQRALFDEINLFVGKRDRIGLVGKNGAGKSSLLKIIAGFIQPTVGQISMPKDTTIGYLAQEMDHAENRTVMQEAAMAFEAIKLLEHRSAEIARELAERDDFQSTAYHQLIEELNHVNDRLNILGTGQMEARIDRILAGLGFKPEDSHRRLSEFSGGWKMRVELAKILLKNPDVLLLDEPTNHLDLESIEWLEEFLQSYPGAVILISHDRTFLDRVTERTVEISKGKVYDYKCSYSTYVLQREEEFQRQVQAFKNQQKQIQDTERLIEKFRAKKNKAAFAQTLIRKLDKMERIEPDDIEAGSIHFRFPPAPHSGKIVMEATGLSKSFGEKQVFQGVDLLMIRQDRIALVGKNGIGKTTLTRILLGKETPNEGTVKPGHQVEIGYYAQDQAEQLDGEKTVLQTIDEVATGDIRTKLRNLLGAFLFSGEDVEKKVKVLSGGEKARLALCKLLLKPSNLLVLDEPTNHLDMRSKDVLKEALMNFDGTLILVSHDRDFLHGLVPVIQEVTPTGLKEFRGDIYDFLKERKADSIKAYEGEVVKQKAIIEESGPTESKVSYKERKEQEKEKRRLKNLVSKLEKEIAEAETRISEMDKELAVLDYTDQDNSQRFLNHYAAEKELLEQKMDEWSKALEQLEEIEADEA